MVVWCCFWMKTQLRERHLAGRAIWPRFVTVYCVRFSVPWSRSLRILCRTATEWHRRTGRWHCPSQRHMPIQTPISDDYPAIVRPKSTADTWSMQSTRISLWREKKYRKWLSSENKKKIMHNFSCELPAKNPDKMSISLTCHQHDEHGTPIKLIFDVLVLRVQSKAS